jgi:hypothetical protein
MQGSEILARIVPGNRATEPCPAGDTGPVVIGRVMRECSVGLMDAAC